MEKQKLSEDWGGAGETAMIMQARIWRLNITNLY